MPGLDRPLSYPSAIVPYNSSPLKTLTTNADEFEVECTCRRSVVHDAWFRYSAVGEMQPAHYPQPAADSWRQELYLTPQETSRSNAARTAPLLPLAVQFYVVPQQLANPSRN